MIKKPMLAGKCEDISKLTYPVLATPKLDGIRCLVINGKAVSRRFKPIPNNHIRNTIEQSLGYYELDGEIMVEGRGFNDLSGDVRREEGKPDFYYAIFDIVSGNLSQPYFERMHVLDKLGLPSFCKKICPRQFSDPLNLVRYEEEMLQRGYEGIMVRSVNSPYKCGRSTANEGYLLKIKRFADAEADIIGVEEETENQNVATLDAFGRTERSSHKENLIPKGTLGAFVGRNRDLWPKDFNVGTGYSAAQRKLYWDNRDKIVNKTKMKLKYQPPPLGAAADDRPRIPVFLGFRDEWDT